MPFGISDVQRFKIRNGRGIIFCVRGGRESLADERADVRVFIFFVAAPCDGEAEFPKAVQRLGANVSDPIRVSAGTRSMIFPRGVCEIREVSIERVRGGHVVLVELPY